MLFGENYRENHPFSKQVLYNEFQFLKISFPLYWTIFNSFNWCEGAGGGPLQILFVKSIVIPKDSVILMYYSLNWNVHACYRIF